MEVTCAAAAALFARYPYYFATVIPGGLYRGSPNDVPTIGVGATLVTSAEVPDELVEALVAAVFENLERFRTMHPALAALEPEAIARRGLTAPLHPAAANFYRKAGLL